MSPTLKSKAKLSSKMAKEQQKASSVSSSAPSNGGNAPTSTSGSSSGASLASEKAQRTPTLTGRLITVVEIEEQTQNSVGNGSECDSASNNGSCSGESEDQKEKASTAIALPSEATPVCDIDKRDKIRQKNERKHQRQKERRAQELHERCTNILMSRKLDLLTQHFVAMGFLAEKATRALILNEGRIEDSVSWLCEGGAEEEPPASNKDGATNMKIDISDELAKLAEMEVKYKCTKQEVQRAVVSCEGDLDKAAETIKTQQKQELPSMPPRIAESGGMVPAVNGVNKVVQPTQVAATAFQGKPTASVAAPQLRREERDPNYSKTAIVGPNMPDQRNVPSQPHLKVQSKSDWSKNQGSSQIDKRWPNATSGPLFSYSLASSSLQAVSPPSKAETRHVVVGEGSRLGLQPGSMREPVIVMQRPQSVNAKPYQPSSSPNVSMPPPVTTGWESNRLSVTDALKIANGGIGQRYMNMSRSTSSILNPNSQPFLHPDRISQSFVSSPLEGDSTSWRGVSRGSGRLSGQPPLASSSSLGIFTGWGSSSGSSGSSSPVDWSNGGLIPQLDYTRVDWSLDSTPLACGELQSQPSNQKLYEAWLTQLDAPNIRNPGMFLRSSRSARIQDNSSFLSVDPINTVLSPDWTSPFAGKDIFRVPRQIVTSPTP